jgi:excisionase family DNA binding protein
MDSSERVSVERQIGVDEDRVLDEQKLVGVTPMLFTAAEAAEQLGISRSTIYTLMNCGRLRSVRIGAARRIRRQDLVEFVNELETAV